jgi:hypothetical protein
MGKEDNDISESEPIIQYVDHEDGKASFLTTFFDPKQKFYRWFALIFICLLSFGSYFCYDNPAALQDRFKKDLEIPTSTFTAFYSWYSWPNVVMSFIGGYLVDRFFGIRLGALIFSGFVMSGQLVFALGAYVNKIWLMDAGRFIFGYLLLFNLILLCLKIYYIYLFKI